MLENFAHIRLVAIYASYLTAATGFHVSIEILHRTLYIGIKIRLLMKGKTHIRLTN